MEQAGEPVADNGARSKFNWTWYDRFAEAQKRYCKPPNYKTPLELGIRLARRGSTSTAIRKARANALNAASTM